MRRAVFEKIRGRLDRAIAEGAQPQDVVNDDDLEAWGTSWNVVNGIFSHMYRKHIMRTTSKVRKWLPQLVRKYDTAASQRQAHDYIILNLAREVRFSPFLLARLIVGFKYGKSKKDLAHALRNPEECIQDQVLRRNVVLCRETDTQYSPLHDKYREIAGDEHEYVLSRKLGALRIPYMAEDTLRDLGFAKTVDFLLETPIAVHGPDGDLRVIFWIDSKAMFGDPDTHKDNLAQLQGYVHRFGPGLVIYWSGFVEDLNAHPDILLTQDMPTRFASLPLLANSGPVGGSTSSGAAELPPSDPSGWGCGT